MKNTNFENKIILTDAYGSSIRITIEHTTKNCTKKEAKELESDMENIIESCCDLIDEAFNGVMVM